VDYEGWLASGERVSVELEASRRFNIFCRVAGVGPWLTLLHGFPTSSWDWAPIAPALERRFRILAFDFLGFGDSDKPPRHSYSIFEQADLVEALWSRFAIEKSAIVGHDYGATVAQELLARREEGGLSVEVSALFLLNSGLYVSLARPLLVQRLLAQPVMGPMLARAVTERTFARSLSSVISPAHALSHEDLRTHWEVVRRGGGVAATPRLLRYMDERAENAGRWEGALERADLPIHLVWGMADPRSGAHIAEHVRRRAPRVRIVELQDVGHYPHLEVPEAVADAIGGEAEPLALYDHRPRDGSGEKKR
jgi:pimeloyl-ACP methyl ester carboxylesterase